jgi:hypothetical protein
VRVSACLLSIASLGNLALSAYAATLPPAGIFVFSSLCEGEADPRGAEIILIRGPAGNTAIYTRTEGGISAPLLAYGPDVKIDNQTGRISLRFVDPEFTKFADGGAYTYEGLVTAEAMDLSGGYVGTMHLPRVTTFDVKLHSCR